MLVEILGKNPMRLWKELQTQYGAKSLINEFEPGWNLELTCDEQTITYLMVKYGDRIKFKSN